MMCVLKTYNDPINLILNNIWLVHQKDFTSLSNSMIATYSSGLYKTILEADFGLEIL